MSTLTLVKRPCQIAQETYRLLHERRRALQGIVESPRRRAAVVVPHVEPAPAFLDELAVLKGVRQPEKRLLAVFELGRDGTPRSESAVPVKPLSLAVCGFGHILGSRFSVRA